MNKEEKKLLFDELYRLDDESDGAEEKSNVSDILAQSRLTASRKRKSRVTSGFQNNQALFRTVSAPIGRSNFSFPGSSVPCHPTHNTTDISCTETTKLTGKEEYLCHPTPKAANTSNFQITLERKPLETSEQTSLSMAGKGKKRKRGKSFDALPDSQQIFKGLSFYFFPNNDVAPARAFRIRKAMEWGAVWIKTWKAGISHVVVDRTLTYKDLLVYLKLESLPPDVVLVNEDYPADCIRFRFVVNPNQGQYLVRGYEEPKEPLPSNTPLGSSDISLQLKPDKNEIAQVPQTSSQSNGSTRIEPLSSASKSDRDPAATHVSDSIPSSSEQQPRDALSEAIEETQAIKGLVSILISHHVN